MQMLNIKAVVTTQDAVTVTKAMQEYADMMQEPEF